MKGWGLAKMSAIGGILLLLSGCGGSSSTAPASATTPTATLAAPAANPGTNETIAVNTMVTLDGSASTPMVPGDTLSYQWSLVTPLPTGSNAQLKNATTPTASFTPDVAGVYTVQLVVEEGTSISTPKDVTVTATAPTTPTPTPPNPAPTAKAATTSAAYVTTGVDTVKLDGSGSTGNIQTYKWTITLPGGSTTTLDGVKPSFAPASDGVYHVRLDVTDTAGLTAFDDTSVAITATTPVDLYADFPKNIASIFTLTPVKVDAGLGTLPLDNPTDYLFRVLGGHNPLVQKSSNAYLPAPPNFTPNGFERGDGWLFLVSSGVLYPGINFKPLQSGTYRIKGRAFMETAAVADSYIFGVNYAGQTQTTTVARGTEAPYEFTVKATQYTTITLYAQDNNDRDMLYINGTIQLVGP